MIKKTQIDDGVIGLEMDSKGFMSEIGLGLPKEKPSWEKKLFDTIYQWGSLGVIADEKSNTCQKLFSALYQQAYEEGRQDMLDTISQDEEWEESFKLYKMKEILIKKEPVKETEDERMDRLLKRLTEYKKQ
jgi:hypothetical protein